jgi:hypothetical protein
MFIVLKQTTKNPSAAKKKKGRRNDKGIKIVH